MRYIPDGCVGYKEVVYILLNLMARHQIFFCFDLKYFFIWWDDIKYLIWDRFIYKMNILFKKFYLWKMRYFMLYDVRWKALRFLEKDWFNFFDSFCILSIQRIFNQGWVHNTICPFRENKAPKITRQFYKSSKKIKSSNPLLIMFRKKVEFIRLTFK